MNLTPGRVCKGGQNIPEPGELERRPPAPGGSGCAKIVAMNVLPIGQSVRIGDDIDGKVIGIWIREGAVQYDVVWWNGRTRDNKWMEASELAPIGECTKTRIGFDG